MNPKCCYCHKEMVETGDSYICIGTWKNPHYNRTAKEGKGWSNEESNKSFERFTKYYQVEE